MGAFASDGHREYGRLPISENSKTKVETIEGTPDLEQFVW
jgi:hypothetical protein